MPNVRPASPNLHPQVYVLRHAKVVTDGICYGRSEVAVELSATEAAIEVAESVDWSSLRIGAIHTSPAKRTRDLAQCLATQFGCELSVDARLAELDFGEWEGRRWEAIYREDRDRVVTWSSDPMNVAPPGGETALELVHRIESWLESLTTVWVLAVTHAGPIRALRALRSRAVGQGKLCLDFDAKVRHLTIEPVGMGSAAIGIGRLM